jgi:hypothetical protein
MEGRSIPTKATLIVVPSQLMGQWPQEVKKFTGKSLKVVTIKTLQVCDVRRSFVTCDGVLGICDVRWSVGHL